MPSFDLEAAARCAETAADAARKEILPRFRNVAVETKGDGSPVTEADRAAERAIRSILANFDPDLPILGEEYGGDSTAEQRGWIIDPIDGTIGFARGLPLFSTLIALIEDGQPVLGLIDLPALGERTIGWRGAGVRRNGTTIHVSDEAELTKSLIAHGDRFCFDRFGWREGFDTLSAELPIFRGYTDAFGHAQVLAGGVDAMIDVDLNPWDAAATQALVPEAGGKIVTVDKRSEGQKLGLIFGSPALVEQLQDRFRQ
jgi:myo-inositol-1(or 4)-monophosphatase